MAAAFALAAQTGSAATIEPLDEHLDHYERMLTSNLALGVQACYRGPRLYDTERTKALLLCSPSNPTGAVYTPAEVAAIGRWAADEPPRSCPWDR